MDNSSLIALQKKAFEAEIAQCPSPRHLIVDNTTEPIVKSLFSDDILNVFYTFNLIDSQDRSKDMNQHAIYLLDPYRRYSIDCLNADYSYGKRYKSATVMFLPGLYDEPWKYLMQNPNFVQAFKGSKPHICYSLGFFSYEPHLFITGAYPSIPAYYSKLPQANELKEYQIEKAVNSMMSMCILFNELPVIRYYNSEIAMTLAKKLQDRLLGYARSNVNFNPSSNRTIFMITDRTMGMFDALCHYDTYRYFVYDFVLNMELEPGAYPLLTYKYNAVTRSNEKIENEVTFDLHDEVYFALKDNSLPQVLSGLKKYSAEIEKESQRLNQLQELEELEQLWKAGKLTAEQKKRLQDLRRVWNVSQTLRDKLRIEKHNQLKSLVNGHINFCNEIKDTQKLAMLREYEAICALYIGSPKEASHLMTPTEGLLQCLTSLSDDDIFDKIRLLIIYTLSRGGIIRADMKKLLMFSLPRNVDKLMNNLELLNDMGLQIFKESLKINPVPKTFFETRPNGSPNHVTAFVPTYCNIVEKLANRSLPETYTSMTKVVNGYETDADISLKTFPYANAGEIQMEETMSYNFESKLKFSSTTKQRPRMYIFAAGGLTASELSMIGNMEDKINHDIYIGTDQIYSVLDMIGDMNEMNSEELNFELNEKSKVIKPPGYLLEATRAISQLPVNDHTTNPKSHTSHSLFFGKDSKRDSTEIKEKKKRNLFGKLKKMGH